MNNEQNKQPAMPESIRKDLEEMAATHCYVPGYESPIQSGEGGGDCFDEDAHASFMAGAQEGYSLGRQEAEAEIAELREMIREERRIRYEGAEQAVKAERERCAELVRGFKVFGDSNYLANKILNPTQASLDASASEASAEGEAE